MRNYLLVTLGYWVFTITDGAIRMLVVLHFHNLGYTPFQVAMLFLFYEFFGVVTNLAGGWLGTRIGLNRTMHMGMGLQIIALLMLTIGDTWLSVPYVMFVQALSGIAKDLNKMSAKASVKVLLPEQNEHGLFKWIAILTGSKNALKGAGFFVGGFLLQLIGFRSTLVALALLLLLALSATLLLLPRGLGKIGGKIKFRSIFSNESFINRLALARFFLFGARDVWFVVGLPVFLYSILGWSFSQVGAFLAVWVIGYGFVQAGAPRLLRRSHHGTGPDGRTVFVWSLILVLVPVSLAAGILWIPNKGLVIIAGLMVFGGVFAINSAVHSYLIVAWSDKKAVSMNVGFYYMANAGGRLLGTVLSGWVYQEYSLVGCLWCSAILLILTSLVSAGLVKQNVPPAHIKET